MGDMKYESWTKITVVEVKTYFGFILLMGMVPLPSLEDYWKRDPVFHYLQIADYISRDCSRDIFILLTTVLLYFEDNQVIIIWGKFGQ